MSNYNHPSINQQQAEVEENFLTSLAAVSDPIPQQQQNFQNHCYYPEDIIDNKK